MTKNELCRTPLRFAALVTALLVLPATASEAPATTAIPDFTQGDRIPEGATHDWNVGPTGARGWMYSNKMETSEARQVYITKVDEGSPADGVFQPGDVVLGLAGRLLAYDPRTELGKAIGEAEPSNGNLLLIRWRKGETTRLFCICRSWAPMARPLPSIAPSQNASSSGGARHWRRR